MIFKVRDCVPQWNLESIWQIWKVVRSINDKQEARIQAWMIYLIMQACLNTISKFIHQTKADTFELQTYSKNLSLFHCLLAFIVKSKGLQLNIEIKWNEFERKKKLNDQKQNDDTGACYTQSQRKIFKNICYRLKKHLSGLYYVFHLFQR